MRKKEFSFLSWFWRFSFSLAARECEGASPEPCYELLTYRQMDGFCYAEVLGGADFIASAEGVPFAPQE